MATTSYSNTGNMRLGPALRPMLFGAAIALLPALFFVIAGSENPAPSWPKYWMIRPLIIIPFAGAMGGLFYFLTAGFRKQGGTKKIIAIIACLLVYLVGLWMGIILGLDGTLWD